MNDINSVWQRIVGLQGETFLTITGIPYSYRIAGNQIKLNNTNRNIPRSNIEQALGLSNPSVVKFQKLNLQGPSYILGIITDKRVSIA